MSKMSNTELKTAISHLVRTNMHKGTLKPIHNIVAVRINNALAIESSIAALNNAQNSKM